MWTLRSKHKSGRDGATASFSPRQKVIAWTGVGFVAGLLFWNLVGLVPDAGVVLRNVPASSGITTASIGVRKHADRPPTSDEASSAAGMVGLNCVTLALDRRERITRARPCEHDHPSLQHSDESDREDLASLSDDFASGIARAIEESSGAASNRWERAPTAAD